MNMEWHMGPVSPETLEPSQFPSSPKEVQGTWAPPGIWQPNLQIPPFLCIPCVLLVSLSLPIRKMQITLTWPHLEKKPTIMDKKGPTH